MSSQTLANFVEGLKETWEPAFAEFLNNSDRTRAQFDKTSRGVVEGKYIKTAAHIGRNSGFGFLGEGEATPTAGHQSFMNTLINAKKAIGRIKLSSEVIQDSATDNAAIADAMSVEKDGLGRDGRREINFLLHHQGNGIIAQCGTTTSSNVVQLAADTPVSVMRYLWDVVAAGGTDSGLVVDLGSSTGTIATAARTATSVDIDAKTVTIDGAAVSTTNTVYLFRKGQAGAGANQRVISSLAQIIDDEAVLYGADPAAFPLWKSTVLDAEDATADEDIFEDAFDLLDIATGDVYGNGSALIVTTHAIRKQTAASMKDRVRYAPLDLKGGFKSSLTVQAGGGPVGMLVDRDTKDRTAYLVDPSSIVRVVAEDWNFVEQAGSPVQYNQDDDSYHILMRARFEYLCKNRRANARIDNLGPVA